MKTIADIDLGEKAIQVSQDGYLVALTLFTADGRAYAAFGRNDARTLAAYLRLHGVLESDGAAPDLRRDSRTGVEHFLLQPKDGFGTYWESSSFAIKREHSEVAKVHLDHGDRLRLADALDSAATVARVFSDEN